MQFNMDRAFRSMENKFDQYRMLIKAVGDGRLRHLFVQGAPGLGKTWEAEQILERLASCRKRVYKRFAGHLTPLVLYNQLNAYKRNGAILVFDDCDAVFENEQAMNILKAATDTKPVRTVAWGSSSKAVSRAEFVYEGSVILMTNHPLTSARYAPLRDRVHVFNLELTAEERLARVIHVIRAHKDMEVWHDRVTMWLIENFSTLEGKLTCRTALKCLELISVNQDDWEELAVATIVNEKEKE